MDTGRMCLTGTFLPVGVGTLSAIKRYMEALEHQLVVGNQIAIDAGVLKVCPYHEIAFYDDGDVTPAYKLGNSRFTAGKYVGVFEDRTEMTDAILKAVQDSAVECDPCLKWQED
jgi:hypothetical protein